jgi:hypothetical protein
MIMIEKEIQALKSIIMQAPSKWHYRLTRLLVPMVVGTKMRLKPLWWIDYYQLAEANGNDFWITFQKFSVLGISCTAFFSVTFGKLPAKGSKAYRTVALATLLAGTSNRVILWHYSLPLLVYHQKMMLINYCLQWQSFLKLLFVW